MLRTIFYPFTKFITILNNQTVIIVGFALFSMFFGAGNLIFPISIGIETQDKFLYSGLGLVCTGIIVPTIGLLSIIFSKSDNLIEYFQPLGKILSYILTFSILGLLGPFSVIPRSIMVASSANTMFMTLLPISIIKLIICIILAVLTLNKNNIVELLGKYLTPLLLLGIILIISFGFFQGTSIGQSNISNLSAFSLGFTEGYQTMDLLASLTFALIITKYLKLKQIKDTKDISFAYLSIASCSICAILLFITYSGFIILGAAHHSELLYADPSQRLLLLSINILGSYSILVVSAIIFLACLTTMCALTDIFADFLSSLTNFTRSSSILITIFISYFISLIKFKTLAIYMGYLLKTIYPALILFTLIRLFNSQISNRFLILSFWTMFLISHIF